MMVSQSGYVLSSISGLEDMEYNNEAMQKNARGFSDAFIYLVCKDKKTGSWSMLLAKHKSNGKWGPPGGKIDRGESPKQAAYREYNEEVVFRGATKIKGLTINWLRPQKFQHRNGKYAAIFVGVVDKKNKQYFKEGDPSNGEIKLVKWVPSDEIMKKELRHPNSVKAVLKYLRSKGL